MSIVRVVYDAYKLSKLKIYDRYYSKTNKMQLIYGPHLLYEYELSLFYPAVNTKQ